MNDILVAMGWDGFFENQWHAFEQEALTPGRISAEHRTEYRVRASEGEFAAELSGRLRHEVHGQDGRPCVGDWVGFRVAPGQTRGLIDRVLLRKTAFTRKVAGAESAAQVLAANIDTVFLVSALDADFNLRRLERYLAQAWDSGAEPVVLLTKTDLCAAPEDALSAVRAVAQGVPVLSVCVPAGLGLEAIRSCLGRGRTAVLLGSSGVGKSTLVNALAGTSRLATQPVGDDGTGRHTTTHRQLIGLPSGGWIVDTPGMRELGLTGMGEGVGKTFEDLGEIFARCRFRDCRHRSEPGCAVREALSGGALDPARWESYQKLMREEAWQGQRAHVQAKRQDKWRRCRSYLSPQIKHKSRETEKESGG